MRVVVAGLLGWAVGVGQTVGVGSGWWVVAGPVGVGGGRSVGVGHG